MYSTIDEVKAEARRREIADAHIAGLRRASRVAEQDGAYREAQRADEEAAVWDFWAAYGVTPEQWDEANRD